MTNEELHELFCKEILSGSTIEECICKFDILPEEETKKLLRVKYCDWLVSVLTKNFIKYDFDKINYRDKALVSLIDNCKKLDCEYHFYIAFAKFLCKDFDKCKEEIHLLLQSIDFSEEAFSEDEFAETFLIPFKNAFDGFCFFIS